MLKPWSVPASRVLSELKTDHVHGLSSTEARRRLRLTGANEIKRVSGPNGWTILLRQLQSPLVYILFFAAVLTFIQGDVVDTTVIMVVVVFNSFIGWAQEYRAEKTMAALHKLLAPMARVIRDSQEQKIAARLLVPGDILLIEAGDRVAADARIIEARSLKINESTLTGEAAPAWKREALVKAEAGMLDRPNVLFASTLVVSGAGTAVVTATGFQTEIGQISKELSSLAETSPTLMRQLTKLGRSIIIIAGFLAGITLLAGLYADVSLVEMLKIAVSLLVSIVPSGLPVVLTVALSAGLLRIFRQNALVRRLSAIETLGETTVICVDKTGTLTEGSMTVEKILVGGTEYTVDGQGYGLTGHFYQDGNRVDPAKQPDLRQLLEMVSLATTSTISAADMKNDQARQLTDPTETAMAVVAAKAGFYAYRQEKSMPELLEVPFNQEARHSTSVHLFNKKHRYIIKGAPEKVIEMCSESVVNGQTHRLLAASKTKLEEAAAGFAAAGYRVTALGYKDEPVSKTIHPESPHNLTFAGLLCLADPIRSDSPAIIRAAQQAGIRVMMITGDHLLTARSIADRIGLLNNGKAVHASDIKYGQINDYSVIARATPQDKLLVVERLQKNGEVVAMTGDGVNDAPALKRADIGISMGLTGTDAAIEASDMVLLKNRFGAAVLAIKEGRLVWENLRKAIFYLVSLSLGEALIVIVALLAGLPLPLVAVQILWMNLATEGVTSIALINEPAEKNIMTQPPRKENSALLTRSDLWRLLIFSLTMTVGTVLLFRAYLGDGLDYARTVALTALVVFQLFNLFNCRSQTRSAFDRNQGTNGLLLICWLFATGLQLLAVYHPLAHQYLQTVPLRWETILAITLTSLSIIVVSEIYKAIVSAAHAWAQRVAAPAEIKV